MGRALIAALGAELQEVALPVAEFLTPIDREPIPGRRAIHERPQAMTMSAAMSPISHYQREKV